MKEFSTNCAFYVRALGSTRHSCRALWDFYDDEEKDCTLCPFFKDVDTYEQSPRRVRVHL